MCSSDSSPVSISSFLCILCIIVFLYKVNIYDLIMSTGRSRNYIIGRAIARVSSKKTGGTSIKIIS